MLEMKNIPKEFNALVTPRFTLAPLVPDIFHFDLMSDFDKLAYCEK